MNEVPRPPHVLNTKGPILVPVYAIREEDGEAPKGKLLTRLRKRLTRREAGS